MKLLFALLVASVGAGCSVTEVRVRNASNTDFTYVLVGGGKFGNIPPHSTTAYQVQKRAERYPIVTALVGDTILGVATFVCDGDHSPLEAGKFTVVLTLKDQKIAASTQKDAP